MKRLLNVKVGQHAQEGGADVDAVSQSEVEKSVETRIGSELGHTQHHKRLEMRPH
jgi:hypothetical protein